MSDLASINTYLMEADRRIGSAQVQLAQKRDELEKLQNAHSDLGTNKDDFIGKKEICLKPEFTTKTLHGENANDLDDFREGQLKVCFLAIPQRQITDAISKIESQIKVVEQEIRALESIIAAQESRRTSLLAQKREVTS